MNFMRVDESDPSTHEYKWGTEQGGRTAKGAKGENTTTQRRNEKTGDFRIFGLGRGGDYKTTQRCNERAHFPKND